MLKTKPRPQVIRAPKRAKKPDPVFDPVFFHKSQISVGAVLLNIGRLTPRTKWKIKSITTIRGSRNFHVNSPEHLSDTVTLERLEAGPHEDFRTRVITFGSLSYQAQWRLILSTLPKSSP